MAAYNHIFRQTLTTPEDSWTDDTGLTTTGDTVTSVSTTVGAYGGAPNAVAIAFTAAGLQSIGLLSTVPCVVTFTGATVIDSVTTADVTLAAGVIRRVASVTGNVTAVSVGVNTTESGLAGTIKISVVFNS